jgi:O-antigen/teichoic acid export membrane protein
MAKLFVAKINQLKNNEFLRNVLIVSGGTFLSQVIILVSSPIVARIYDVKDFGSFQQYQAVLSFFAVIGALRYEWAILVAPDEKDSLALTLLSSCISFLIFILLIIISLFTWFSKSFLYNLGISKQFILFLPFAFIGISIYQILSNYFIRKRTFAKLSSTKILQSVGSVSAQIGSGYIFLKPIGLFLGDMIGKLIGGGILSWNFFLQNTRLLKTITKNDIKKNLFKYKQYPLFSAPGAILNTGGTAIPMLLIGHYYGLEALGFYALVDRVFSAPSLLVGQSISQVYTSEFSRLLISNPVMLKSRFINLAKKLALNSLIPFLIAALFAPYIFSFVFGHQWKAAGTYFIILAPMQYVSFCIWPLMPTLMLLEKQKLQLVWEITRILLTCGVLIFSFYSHFTIYQALIAFSFIMIITYFFHMALSYWSLKIKSTKSVI